MEMDAGPSTDTRVIVPTEMLDSQTVTLLQEGEEGQAAITPTSRAATPAANQDAATQYMPWEEGYRGPPSLARLAATLRAGPLENDELERVAGGQVSTALITLPTGEVEVVQTVRTRYAVKGERRCDGCGQRRPAASEEDPGLGGSGSGAV